jgi:hypothetical protein
VVLATGLSAAVQTDPVGVVLGNDALAGRLVLMRPGDPVRALAHMTRWVRPGGIITFQEFTVGMTHATPEMPLMTSYLKWGSAALRQVGVNPEFGDTLPVVFRRAGLPDPGFVAFRVGGDADSLVPEYMEQTIQSLAPLAMAAGVATEEELKGFSRDAITAQARERDALLCPQEMSCAWVRRPESELAAAWAAP